MIISTAQTKLEWYDAPLYPFLAILAAIFIYYIFDLLQNLKWINQRLRVNVIPFIFLFLIGITPYQKILDKTYKPKEYSWDKDFYEIGYFLQDAIRGKHKLNGQYLLYYGYNAQNLFYLKILNNKGIQISFKDWRKLAVTDIVIAHQNQIKQYIEMHYKYEIIHIEGNVVTYKIISLILK